MEQRTQFFMHSIHTHNNKIHIHIQYPCNEQWTISTDYLTFCVHNNSRNNHSFCLFLSPWMVLESMRFIVQYIKETPQSFFVCYMCMFSVYRRPLNIEYWTLNGTHSTTQAMRGFDDVRAFNVNKLYHLVWQKFKTKRNVSQLRVYYIQYMQIHVCLKLHIHWWALGMYMCMPSPYMCVFRSESIVQTTTHKCTHRNQIEWKRWNAVEQQFEDASMLNLHSVIELNSIWPPRVVRSSSSSSSAVNFKTI